MVRVPLASNLDCVRDYFSAKDPSEAFGNSNWGGQATLNRILGTIQPTYRPRQMTV